MMLTVKQPVHYGYRTVHDLPTPPRSSPPVVAQDSTQKPISASQNRSPPAQPMTGSHRSLPLPAAMTLSQPPPAPSQSHQQAPGPSLHSQAPPAPSAHNQTLGALPAPPAWQGSDDSMKTWLIAKAEEERRRQEEEKTRQESLRLEQRKLEHDMLRTSFDRGIPPPMIPVMFAGIGGGTLPQAALEFAQQYLMPQVHQQILPAQGPASPDHRRDSQPYGPYSGSVGVPSTPGSGPAGQGGFVPYQGPGSPTRPRAHTMAVAGSVGRQLEGSNLPRLRTSEMAPGPSAPPSYPAHVLGQQQSAAQQQEQSPSIYFHHWTPPTSQPSSNQPGTPSVESPRKRKATGPQPAVPAPPQTRNRSPPFSQQISNPPPGRRRGHSRQRSDISSYRPIGRGRGESFGHYRGPSPGFGSSREGAMAEPSQTSQQPRSSAHSVSSLLSDQPSPPRFTTSEMRSQQQRESERRNSPGASGSDDKSRGGTSGPTAPRE